MMKAARGGVVFGNGRCLPSQSICHLEVHGGGRRRRRIQTVPQMVFTGVRELSSARRESSILIREAVMLENVTAKSGKKSFSRKHKDGSARISDTTRLLFNSTLNGHKLDSAKMKNIISTLQSLMQSYEHDKNMSKVLSAPVIARLMFGMSAYNNRDAHISKFLVEMDKALARVPSTSFNAKSFSMCLYGLRNMSTPSSHHIIHNVLQKLRIIGISLPGLCPTSLSHCIQGLRSLSPNHMEVQEIMAILTDKAARIEDKEFSNQLVCNCLAGLVQHDLSSHETLGLLHVLATKLQSCDAELDANLMGVMFSHLQKIKVLREEVLTMLTVLKSKVQLSSHNPSPIQISNMLYSTHNFSSTAPEIIMLHKVLIDTAHRVDGKFSPRCFSKCVSSLKHIDTSRTELQSYVALLRKWCQNGFVDNASLNSMDMDACVLGLSHLKNVDTNGRQLVKLLAQRIESSPHPILAASVARGMSIPKVLGCQHKETQYFLKVLKEKVDVGCVKLNIGQLSMIRSLDWIESRTLLQSMASMLVNNLAAISKFPPKKGLSFLVGLQRLDSSDPVSLELLSIIHRDLEKSGFQLEEVRDMDCSLRLGFIVARNLFCVSNPTATMFLSYLTLQLNSLSHIQIQKLSVENIIDCLHSLKNLPQDCDEVQEAASSLRRCLSVLDNYHYHKT